MSRALLIVTVLAAAYGLVNILLSMVVAAAWRSGAASRRSPGHIVWWRALPVAGSLFAAFALVAPAFTAFEPLGRRGVPGPVLWALATVAAALVLASAIIAIHAALVTFRTERLWLRRATALPIDPPAGVPAFAIDSPDPIVALVGVFSPKLVAARLVIDACSPAELASIVAHERGHLQARDNLKRWLMTCAPDALRWTPLHGEMVTAWSEAAEDAADDAATGDVGSARLDLAALLLKIARLGTPPAPLPGISPLVPVDGLERRVRRLVAVSAAPATEGTARWLLAGAALLVTTSVTVMTPEALNAIYEATEAVIRLGR